MPANDHLRIASSELIKATELLRREIDDLRSEATNLGRMVEQHISRLLSELQMHDQEAKKQGANIDQNRLQSTMRDIENQIAYKKSQHGDDLKRIEDIVREKQKQITHIEAQARNIAP